ncbi:hypothetical protein LIER_24959 [Lithospermum erythrorhizon]|uniref:Uncharacterized protein n=1 Tax=Lithospermum erythrorhizon TaxID=34254 RepID=A0AAV3R583_LITER
MAAQLCFFPLVSSKNPHFSIDSLKSVDLGFSCFSSFQCTHRLNKPCLVARIKLPYASVAGDGVEEMVILGVLEVVAVMTGTRLRGLLFGTVLDQLGHFLAGLEGWRQWGAVGLEGCGGCGSGECQSSPSVVGLGICPSGIV